MGSSAPVAASFSSNSRDGNATRSSLYKADLSLRLPRSVFPTRDESSRREPAKPAARDGSA